jgi:uncharacterized membrane protein YtjA (UPF0391 family)
VITLRQARVLLKSLTAASVFPGNTCRNQSTHSAIYRWEALMLRYAAIFFIIAIIAAVFGFGGIAAGAAEIAKVLFFIFIVIFLVTLLMGVIRR